MQRINFTETTLNTLKRNARCSFANAVYKLGIKAQQGLKCDDLFKKSVLMNEVNKLLCKYKLDECISFHPAQEGGVSTWNFNIGSFSGIITYYLLIDGVSVIIGRGTNLEEISIDINSNTETTGVSSVIGEDGYITITSPVGCFIKADLSAIKDPPGAIPATTTIFLTSKCAQEETCVDYTEEELNCITPQDLQVLYEFTHKYKETLAKSTKKITNQTTSNSNSTSSDCCNWGSIGGSIGNQSDLVAYLQTIEKNFISAYDESTLLSSDIKSLKFLGAGVTATNSSGDISITIPGGGSGGSVAWGAITGTLTAQTDLTSYLASNYYPLSGNPSGFLTNISAINGLTENPTNTVKLGGTLIEDTIITQPDFTMNFRGTVPLKPDSLVSITTTGASLGAALTLNSVKNALEINATTVGISINSSTSPISAQGTSGSSLSKTGTTDSAIDTILTIQRSNTGFAPSLINSGISIAWAPGNLSDGSPSASSLLSLLYEDPTAATVQTKFRFSPLGLGTTTFGSTLETFGSGKLKLPAYGGTAFTGTVAYLLAVDSSGNVIETSASGGGATDLGYTASPTNGIVTSSTGTDATLTLADGTNAGLLAPADFTKLGNQSGTNTGDNATNSTSNTYADGKVADAITNGVTTVAPSQNAVFDALALLKIEEINLQDIGTALPASTYTFVLEAKYARTINELTVDAGAGTCTLTMNINGTPVTGISAVSVSTTKTTYTATAANSIAINDLVTIVTSSNSGLENLQITVKTTRV